MGVAEHAERGAALDQRGLGAGQRVGALEVRPVAVGERVGVGDEDRADRDLGRPRQRAQAGRIDRGEGLLGALAQPRRQPIGVGAVAARQIES